MTRYLIDFCFIPTPQKHEEQLRNEDLLADDESFHGSVARRIEQISNAPSSSPMPTVDEAGQIEYPMPTVDDAGQTGYAMAVC